MLFLLSVTLFLLVLVLVLEGDAVKQFADVGAETDSIIEAPVKTFVNVGTQTEPLDVFIDQPVVELAPERRRRKY